MARLGWRKTIHKLRAMDRRELLERTRQALSQRRDAALARLGYNFGNSSELGSAHRASFFFRPEQTDNLVQLIRQRIPGQAQAIVARAEKILAHRFDLLGYEDLDYGPSIDWQLDLVHGKKAPRKPFYCIKYLDFAEVGDSKVIWELNRHQHFVTLAKAYRLNGDQRFVDEIMAQWRSWHEQNPYPVGINWASSLEVGFRSLSWIWTFALLQGTKLLTPEFRTEYLQAQSVNGRHLNRYLSTYFSPNTHLLGEGVALFFLGVLCSSLKNAEGWRSRGWKIVLEESERQVHSDGLHFEHSIYYHVYALDFFVHATLFALRNGVSVPARLERTLERMMTALFALSVAGPPPRFGDDDGGRLFDPVRNRDEHLLDPLATGAILFQRGDFKALCRDLREETIWLVGEDGVTEWDRLQTKPTNARSTALAESGIYTLGSSPDSQLVVKAAPSKATIHGHAHADALSICLQSSGRSLLIDPGTCEYVGEHQRRNVYRGTSMHNTLTVDGDDQFEPAGPFSWKGEIEVRAEQWISGQTFDLFVGSHNGYARLPDAAQHQRWVFALKSGLYLVRDCVEGTGEHHLELSWRLRPDLQMVQEHLFRVKNSSQGLAVLPVNDHGWAEEVHKGAWSPVYGVQRTTTVLKFAKTCRLPAEFALLLVPLPEANGTPGTFLRPQHEAASANLRAYQYQTFDCDHRFFFSSARKRWSFGVIASDAELVCVSRWKNAQGADIVLCNGSYVELNGKRVLEAAREVAYCEVMSSASRKVLCNDI
jgi:hypothetical protein